MTLVLAREMKKYGVTANVVCPRALTRMTDERAGRGRVHERARVGARTTSRRSVAFLASDAAADVSGQVFVVWGTRVHLMEGWQLADDARPRRRPLDAGGADRPQGRAVRGAPRKIPPMGFGQ